MRIIAYVRTSTGKQDIGLDVQKRAIISYCDTYGHTLVDVASEQRSASSVEGRSELARALEAVSSGACDGIAVYKLDRLTRSVRDLGDILDSLNGKSIVSVMDHMDTSTANGRMILNILTSIAQWEREAISERTKSALDVLKEEGKVTGAIPYGKKSLSGKRRDFADKKTTLLLVDCDDEIEVISKMKRIKKDFPKISYREIASLLHDEGIVNRKGKQFHPEEVRRILNADQ